MSSVLYVVASESERSGAAFVPIASPTMPAEGNDSYVVRGCHAVVFGPCVVQRATHENRAEACGRDVFQWRQAAGEADLAQTL